MPAPSTRHIEPLLPTAAETPADYTVINGRQSQLSGFNAGGTTVSAMSYKENVSLTPTELAALAATSGVIVTAPASVAGTQLRFAIKRFVRFRST